MARSNLKPQYFIVAALVVILGGVSVWTIRSLVNEPPVVPDLDKFTATSPVATASQIARAEMAVRTNGIISNNIRRFRNHMGRFPSAIDELVEKPKNLGEDEKWSGPYFSTRELLLVPWRNPYRYQSPGVRHPSSYDLWSCGPDGISGNADDITN
jgi:hypothetical protein